jgi:hypothetical protein
MKKIALTCLILLLASASAEDEHALRFKLTGGYLDVEMILPSKPAWGPTAGLQILSWGSFYWGLDTLLVHIYDYEHSYYQEDLGTPGYGKPHIENLLFVEGVIGGFWGTPELGWYIEGGIGYGFHAAVGGCFGFGGGFGAVAEFRIGFPYIAGSAGLTYTF